MSVFKAKTLEPTHTPDPMWIDIAIKELGVKEYSGPAANPRIVEYASHTTLKATSDETPWCSSFVNYCIDKSGYKGTHNAMARSWLKWGTPCTAKRGAIVIFSRGNDGVSGHVAFVLRDLGNEIECISGNTNNSVAISKYPKDRILGIRWPA